MARVQCQGGRIQGRAPGLLSSEVEREERLARAMAGLPPLEGRPVRVVFRRALSVSGRHLFFHHDRGTPVHAATYIPQRRMVLERSLLEDPAELRRIVIHELFHFVWWRLGNPARRSWEKILEAEFRVGAKGELGWSSECRKIELTEVDVAERSARWREYACEALCDSAAWYFARRPHAEHTLAPRFQARRRAWLQTMLSSGRLSI